MRVPAISSALLLLAACGQPDPAAAIPANGAATPPAPAGNASPAAVVTPPTPTAVAAPQTTKTVDESNAGVVKVLSDLLVRVGRLDDAPITGVRQVSRCTVAFAAGPASATIDWSKVGDWLSRNDGGRVVIPIASAGRTYRFTVPQAPQPEPVGDAGATVESAFGSLVDGCGGG